MFYSFGVEYDNLIRLWDSIEKAGEKVRNRELFIVDTIIDCFDPVIE
jgi:hypothetical protein